MKLPLQISFRNMEHVPAIEDMIRAKAMHLDHFANDIMSCRVVIEPAAKHHQHGNQYEVKIDIKLSGEEIVVSREPGEHREYRDVQIAIRDAFDAAIRRVEDYVRRRRGDVKVLDEMPHAKVACLFPQEGYGFLRTPEGREVYFHKHSVLDGFERLEEGNEVRFVEEEGVKGPQASTVRLAGRHHHL
jgi:cold shock CspA family protein/ribosome-associated translation inhibitor RaiA